MVVMACTATSRLFGYLKVALIGALFGSSGVADVVNAVFGIPNDLRKLFAEGAISAAFIPALSTALAEDLSGARARLLARSLLTFQLLILAPLVALSVARPQILASLLLRFPDPRDLALAAGLLRWMFSFVLLVSLAATVMAVLNTHQSFAIPALSPLLFSATIIGCMIGLRRVLGPYAIAVGVAAGGMAQLLFQLPAYLRKGYTLRPAVRFATPDFRRTLGLWIPFVASASVFAANQLAARWFASRLEQGSVSAIYNAVVFLQVPLGVFTASVNTVTFPRMSREAAAGDLEALRATVSSGIELLTALLVPAAVFLALYGGELVMVALERGRFGARGTLLASRALTAYAIGLPALGLYSFLQRLCFALGDYRAPLASAAAVVVTDVGLSLLLQGSSLRSAGLACANSAAFAVGLVLLLAAARRHLGPLGGLRALRTAALSAAASLPVAGVVAVSRLLAPGLMARGSTLASAAVVAATTVLSAALALLALSLWVPAVRELLAPRRRSVA
jgi:putative peptidoglycan lipid II flippase